MSLAVQGLLIGGIATFCVALLHVYLAIRPQAYAYFGAEELAEMHAQGSSFTLLVTIALVIMFIAWGFYGLSGAGLIGPLPWLRTVLFIIAAIYILRGLMLPGDIVKLFAGTRPLRFALVSSGSLAAGLLYLFGALAN